MLKLSGANSINVSTNSSRENTDAEYDVLECIEYDTANITLAVQTSLKKLVQTHVVQLYALRLNY